MSVKIRLSRHGAKKSPFYRIVVSDSRAPRDGRYIEQVGTYNPRADTGGIKINSEKIERWLQRSFSLEDFKSQLQTMKKMGSIGELMDLIPGGRKLSQKMDMTQADREFKRVEAIINSMTIGEQRNPTILNGSRRRRIAQGSGTSVTEINRLIKQFMEMRKMMQRMNQKGARALFNRTSMPFR